MSEKHLVVSEDTWSQCHILKYALKLDSIDELIRLFLKNCKTKLEQAVAEA